MTTRTFQRIIRGILFLFIIGWAAFASAGTRDPNTPDEKYLAFGKEFPFVVRIKATVPCDKPDCKIKEHDQFGSAVIIRGHWIITAAHVVFGSTQQAVIADTGEEHKIDHLIVHGDYTDDKFGYHDLAIGYTAKDFRRDFYCPLYRDSDELGKAITIAGYGIHGTFSTGATLSDGKKRGGHNKIESIERAVLVCTPSTGLTRMPLEFMIAPGDSGGGMFIGNKLAGINSFLMAADKKPDGTYGDESAFIRISLYADWIESQIEKHELALRARSTTGVGPLVALDAE